MRRSGTDGVVLEDVDRPARRKASGKRRHRALPPGRRDAMKGAGPEDEIQGAHIEAFALAFEARIGITWITS